jgi:hypothetical protein
MTYAASILTQAPKRVRWIEIMGYAKHFRVVDLHETFILQAPVSRNVLNVLSHWMLIAPYQMTVLLCRFMHHQKSTPDGSIRLPPVGRTLGRNKGFQ